MTIVFDTNIYVAAFRSHGFLFDLLYKVFRQGSGYLLCISPAIKHELQETLLEKNFNQQQINEILLILNQFAYLVEPVEKIYAVKDDPDDNKILECAVAAEADLIVTMDKHLLKLKLFRRTGIVHPKAFSYMFPE